MNCCPSPRPVILDAGTHCQRCGLFIPKSRRLTDLAQGGYVVDTGETEMGSRGRYVSVWRVVS